jgi:hypothetical protein
MTTTTTAPITLDELNAERSRDWVWNETYNVASRFAVGRSGSPRRRGTSGDKIHLLVVNTITAITTENKMNASTRDIGMIFSGYGMCGGNGQVTAMPVKGMTIADVTCTKCLKKIALLNAAKAAL